MNKYILLNLFLLLFISNCEKQTEKTKEDQSIAPVVEISEDSPSLEKYRGMPDELAPDGKTLRIYNDKVIETQLGHVYSPILYLYNKEGMTLAIYNIFDLIPRDFIPVSIDIFYNNKRNSFDLLFSANASGNYGTGYIDLNTNEYVREDVHYLIRTAGYQDKAAPNGKILRICEEEVEASWGSSNYPIVYLFDKENRILAKYSTFDLISENWWVGIEVSYNNGRNSFDMVFSVDSRGNYGTGYIDLNTNEYVRDLFIMPID